MALRDKRESQGRRRGARAAARSRAPDLLQSEESEEEDVDGGLLAGMNVVQEGNTTSGSRSTMLLELKR